MKTPWNVTPRPGPFLRALVGILACLGACEKDLVVYASATPAVGGVAAASDGGVIESGGAGAQGAAITSGSYFSCSIASGGVRCWGDNAVGQLGNNTTTNNSAPAQVLGLAAGAQAVAAENGDHVCALVNGGVLCWGNNANGQLGNGSTTNSAVPVQVLGLSSGVTAIAVGSHHSCALVDGGAWCWGMNYYGQLGSDSGDSSVPVQVLDSTGAAPLTGISAITGGGFHTCAVVDGGAWCWGSDGPVSNPAVYGALGDNYNSGRQSSFPVPVQGLSSGVRGIAAGYYFTCALVDGGAGQSSIWCWGDNRAEQLGAACAGDYSLMPVPLIGLSGDLESIAAGVTTACVVAGGGAFCWGSDSAGQLGPTGATDTCTIGGASLACSAAPIAVPGLGTNVQAIAVGYANDCAVAGQGVECWGDDRYGESGNGSTTATTAPVLVASP